MSNGGTNGNSNGNGNGIPNFSLKNLMSSAGWVIQAALIGIVTLLAHWVQNQNEVNTQTVISLNAVTRELADRKDEFKEFKAKYEKLEERQRSMELSMANLRKPN